MLYSFIFFANADVPPGPNWILIFSFMFLGLIIMWLLLASPQKRQEERMRKMLAALEKNDKVMTVGGLIGTVHSIDREQNEIVLKVDESTNTKLRFHLTAVSTVFSKDGDDKK